MKKAILSLSAIFMLAFVSATYAQDDLYYNPSDDYFQEEIAEVERTADETPTRATRNNNDCSYCYTSRIRRFRSNYRGFNYYDPCYTDGYYYNGAAGSNIYLTAGSPYSYYNTWSRPNNWLTWNSPYNTYGSAYNQYYNTWSNPYAYGNYYGYGNSYNTYGSAAYCPPNAYGSGAGSYYAGSTPGNTNTAPRGVRTSNFSNPTADIRGGSGRSGSNPDGGGKITPTRNNTASSANTTSATRRTTRNNTPAASSSTRSTRNKATTPSTKTRSNKRTSRFGSMMNSGNRNSSSTRSSRSNSSYKPSSTRSSSSRSNSSFRSGGSSSKSSSTRSSSRGGRN